MKLHPHTFLRTSLRGRRTIIFSSVFLLFLVTAAALSFKGVIASSQSFESPAIKNATQWMNRYAPTKAVRAMFFAPVVTNGNDSGSGSLRDAISLAAAGDIITFSGVTNVTLTSGELAINKNLTIDGGSGVTVTRSGGNFRIFNVGNFTVSMNDLTISNGNVTGSGAGINNAGNLTLTRCTLTQNTASVQGGGIENAGTLTMTDCTVSNNIAYQAAGLQNDSSLTMLRCTVKGNTTILSPNQSPPVGFGAGLLVYGSTTNVTNCTFTGNSTADNSGAIGIDAAVTATFTNCTITGNTDKLGGAGVTRTNSGATIILHNCIVVGNTSTSGDGDILGNLSASGTNNIIGTSTSVGLTTNNNNQLGVSLANTLLGTLGTYGGLTEVFPLLPGSPAINAANAVKALTTDQRSKPRVGTADIGAFESQGFTIAINSGDGQSTGTNTAFANPLSVTVTSSNSEPVDGGKVTFTPPGSGASAAIAGNPASISSGVATTGVVTANGTVGSSYSVSAAATGANTVNFSLSNTAPATVSSINRTSGTAACANTSVSWTVTFNQAVTGVTNTNFSLVGGTGPSITNVMGSGATWTVTANVGTAAGTLGLNMVNSTGVSPTVTNLTFTGQTYTINPIPTITLGSSPFVGQGATSANLPYTATTGSPNQYSIDYDATANSAGFVDVTNASLLASPIALVVPSGATAGTYNATLTVRDSSSGCAGSSVPFTITISSCPSQFTVNDLGDASDATPGNGVCATSGGVCTLRAAIEEANALTPCTPLTINFSVNGTITLGSALPAIAHPNLTINGPGASSLAVSGNDAWRVLSIASGNYNVNISGLTLTHGYIKAADTTAVSGNNFAPAGSGGGMYSLSTGTVNVTDCVVTNNTAQGGNATGGTSTTGGDGAGAGIYLGGGTASLTRCTINSNSALGGLGMSGTSNFDGTGKGAGIYKNSGTLTVTDCTIADNITDRIAGSVLSSFTQAQGAGIYNSLGSLSVSGSTFSGNRRPLTITLGGAAIANQANTNWTLTNCTFSGNIGSNTIAHISTAGVLTMVNCTVAKNTLASTNTAAGAVFNQSGSTLNLKNTILANNINNVNIRKFGTVTSQGNNFDSDGSTGFSNGVNGDIVGTSVNNKDPLLAPLGNYGGLTQTQALLPGSPAIDAGTSSGAPTTDQRGNSRVGATDIGAVEAQTFALTITGGNNQSTTVNTAFSNALQVNLKEGANNLPGAVITFAGPGNGFSINPTSGTATTDSSGIASRTVTANTTAGGPYNVTALIGSLTAIFKLTNLPDVVTKLAVAAPSNALLGVAFNFDVVAQDQFNNKVTSYSGMVQFTSTDTAASLPASTALTNGMGTFSATLNSVGNQKITATDKTNNSITGTSQNIQVNLAGCPSAFTVTSLNDTSDANLGDGVCDDGSGKCTLRAAIQEANVLTSCTPLTINFNVSLPNTIPLSTALPVIAHPNLTITGPGANQLTVDGGNAVRPFEIGSGNYAVTMSGLKVANGSADGGGGLRNQSTGIVSLNSMTFDNNRVTGSSGGGGIRHIGNGTLNVNGSTFINNNSSGSGGGGINNFSPNGIVNVTNCTFSGNTANLGGGIHTQSTGTTNITNCTLISNSGGIRNNSGTVAVKNTIAVGNTTDISGTVTGSNNLTGSLASALIGPLGNYGGTTDTFPLLPGSPAIDAGTSSGAPTNDQRGKSRVGNVDIGAFESQGFTLAINNGNNQSTPVTTAFASALSVKVTANDSSEPINGGQVIFTPPGSGASATVAGTPATISNGIATTGTVTANATAGGPYNVVASASGAPANINFSLTNTLVPVTVNVPTGISFTLNSQNYTGSQTINLAPGSYTLLTTSPQSTGAGTQLAFQNWSDGGLISHSIIVGSTPVAITGSFKTQYQLTINAGTGGTVSPASGTFYDSGQVVNVTATPNADYNFTSWTGSVANANSASTTVTMDAPKTITANFINPPPTVASIVRANPNPTGLDSVSFTVTFSESVTGVSASNFSLAASGVTGAMIKGVSGNGNTWTVNINPGCGSGTVGLNMTNSTNVTDSGGAGINNLTFTGEVYTVSKAAPSPTTNPTSQLRAVGATATFTAAANGVPPPTVQWQVSTDNGSTFSNIPNETNTTLSFTTIESQNGNQYRAVFTNSCGSASTSAAILTLCKLAVVTTDPQNQTATPNSNASFTAAASGSPTPTVQWQVSIDGGNNFSDINGATQLTLNLTNVTSAMNGYQYRAVFSNTCGNVISKAATLSTCTTPTITTEPTDLNVLQGGTAKFTAAASGTPTPTVQWQVSVNGGPYTDISGENSTTLSISNVTPAMNNNRYRAVFSNTCSTNRTAGALLNVSPYSSKFNDPLVCVGPGNLVTVTASITNNGILPVQASYSVTNLAPNLIGIPGSGLATSDPANFIITATSANWNGTVQPGQTVDFIFKATIAPGVAQGTQICITSTGIINNQTTVVIPCMIVGCPNAGVRVQVSDQKPGSVLVFPYYTSGPQSDTRVTLSNISATETAFVHLFFVAGTSCQETDQFLCLTPNASISLKMSDYDPGQTGWLLAVAVNNRGIPIRNNILIGNAFVNDGNYIDTYGAESFSANGPLVAAVNDQSATLFFDGLSYDAVPNQLTVELQSTINAPNQRLVTAALNGSLVTSTMNGAAQIGVGTIINGNEKPFGSFSNLLTGSCQSIATITASNPRVPLGLNGIIPSGQVGTLRLNVGGSVGLLMTPRGVMFSGIRTLHKTSLTTTMITIPIFVPVC